MLTLINPSPVVDAKLKFRKKYPRVPVPFSVFWHCAAVNNWKDVVNEQFELFKDVGLSPKMILLGNDADLLWVKEKGINVVFHDKNLDLWELPTLGILYKWCKANPEGSVVFVHTKGVTQPWNAAKYFWRLAMENWVIKNWKQNLYYLVEHDVVGCYWLNSTLLGFPGYPCFSGTFWCARADYINTLQDPVEYIAQGKEIPQSGLPWKRFGNEAWIGSNPTCIVCNLYGFNGLPWHDSPNAIKEYEKYRAEFEKDFKIYKDVLDSIVGLKHDS